MVRPRQEWRDRGSALLDGWRWLWLCSVEQSMPFRFLLSSCKNDCTYRFCDKVVCPC
jgi:hypothetical protein